jgi:hypothetical protein
MLLVILALALTSLLPVIAQDNTTSVEYIYNGTELQRLENGVVVQAWTMPYFPGLYQTAAILQARAQYSDPAMRYTFDADRMYMLRDNQVVGLWLLRDGKWVDEPALVVSYDYNGQDAMRFVNGRLQQTWALVPGVQTYGFVTMMQAQANELVAEHVSQELHVEYNIEHIPQLLADKFTLHYTPLGETPDMSWYSPEAANIFATALNTEPDKPLTMAVEDLVLIRQPVIRPYLFDILNPMTPVTGETPVTFYDVYRFENGKVTDIWLDYDLAALIQPN